FSTLTITTTAATPGGTYPLIISGVGGGVTNTAAVNLVVVGIGANLVWNSTTNSTWDVLGTSNWFNATLGVRTQFNSGDNVLFDDTAGLTNAVNIASGVAVFPANLTNNS